MFSNSKFPVIALGQRFNDEDESGSVFNTHGSSTTHEHVEQCFVLPFEFEQHVIADIVRNAVSLTDNPARHCSDCVCINTKPNTSPHAVFKIH